MDVVKEVMDMASRWHSLGLALRIKVAVLDTIYSNNPTDSTKCLKDMLLTWLQKSYDFKKYGPPCWKMLCHAVFKTEGGNNPALALKIADCHK